MKKLFWGTILLVLAIVVPIPTMAQVNISVGIPLPPPIVFRAPPDVVVLPETEVYAVPSVPEEIFFCNGWWWRPWHGHWYRSLRYDSGWGVFGGVPVWYNGIPRGWRDDYRNHMWGGHPWNYSAIHHSDLQRNWRTWHNTNYWNKPENRQFTHSHDGRLYEGGQGKVGTGRQANLNKGTTTGRGTLQKGTTTGQGKVGTGGHGATGTKVHSSGQTTKGHHATAAEEKKK